LFKQAKLSAPKGKGSNMNIIPARLATSLHRHACLLATLAILSFNVLAEVAPVEQDVLPEQLPDEQVSLSVEELKKQVIKLNRDLFILEEDLLFPANTQLVVYVSFATGKFLNLDSISLKVDDEVVAAHLYTERQLQALKRGGMQRLFMGNLKTGEHEITAVLHGIGPNKKDYKLAASKNIEKATDLTALEIRIEDQAENYQPLMTVIEWEE
tara:strand:+ start:1688 stop:2323 length:636 start_codon:yes stop_codon:yes gene_type:complete